MKLGKDIIFSKKTEYGLKFTKPHKASRVLGAGEKEILWTLYTLGSMSRNKLCDTLHKDINTSLGRLRKKRLVKLEKSTVKLTDVGCGAILHYAVKGKTWSGYRKIPKVKSKFKLVVFDLDDTLIPGFVSKDVDVELMRKILRTLKKSGVKTSVLSVNPDTTVYKRLRNYGLLRYIDIPFQTSKSVGMKKLLNFTQLKPEEVLFVGHSIDSDFLAIKNADERIPVVLFKDTFSRGDARAKPPKVEGSLIIPRDFTTFIKVLEGKIRETDDKNKLIKTMHEKMAYIKPTVYVYTPRKPARYKLDVFKFVVGDIIKIVGKKAKKFAKKKKEKKKWYNKSLEVVESTPEFIRARDVKTGKIYQFNKSLAFDVIVEKYASVYGTVYSPTFTAKKWQW